MDLFQKTSATDEFADSADEGVLAAEISRRIRDGDSAAENELIRQFQPGLRMILYRRTGGDEALVDDLVQETMLIVLQRLRGEGLQDPAGLAAFAAQTARNLSLGVRRKYARQRTDSNNEAIAQTHAPSAGVDEQVSDAAVVQAVRRMLDELPSARDRALLKRFYLDEGDKDALCREFELAEGTLNQALNRARSRFRAILALRGFNKSDFLSAKP
jgi:RNA polymerase sigma-70 factor (ECF subfamily)